MNARIKELRKSDRINLSQEAFGKKIGLSGGAISLIEHGKRALTDSNILAICREFGVNEEWLRTGNGDRFREMSVNDEISSFIGNTLTDKPDFRRRLISVLARLTPEDWKLIEAKVRELVADEETKNADP